MGRTFYIITNDAGDIVAAAPEYEHEFILPGPKQRMHKIVDVPEEIASFKKPDEFHRAITEHFLSNPIKVSLVDPVAFRQSMFKQKKTGRRR
jgi:hypothetical protein